MRKSRTLRNRISKIIKEINWESDSAEQYAIDCLLKVCGDWALEMVGDDLNWSKSESRKFSTNYDDALIYQMNVNLEKESIRYKINMGLEDMNERNGY